MDYEAFRHAWTVALRESRLPAFTEPAETLDWRNMDRTYKVYVEPLGGQDAPPFHVTATLSWRWTGLNAVRGRLRDEDVLTEMLGRDQSLGLETERPYVRVDIKLSASAPYDKPLPMPGKQAWRKWVQETIGRLERIEPLLPDEIVRESRMGMTEILAWQEPPRAITVCDPSGDLLLDKVEIAAGQLVTLPRQLDEPDERDEGPEEELEQLFSRVRASLMAWMQALDHLRG